MRIMPAVLLVFVACSPYEPPSAPRDEPADVGPDKTPTSLTDSLVVCEGCTPGYLRERTKGIMEGMRLLIAYAGSDIDPKYAPVTFHLSGDKTCGSAEDMRKTYGFLTGFAFTDGSGKGQICMFDLEKMNPDLPEPEKAAHRIDHEVLPIHEAGHIWFYGRQGDYSIQEPFVKMMSLTLTQVIPDMCRNYGVASCPDCLVDYLCDAGMRLSDVPDIYRDVDDVSKMLGRQLTIAEFAAECSAVVGRDVTKAFQQAGILK